MQEFSRAVEEQATQRNTTPQLQLFATSLAAVFQILGELSGLLFFFVLFLEPPFIRLFNKLIPDVCHATFIGSHLPPPTHTKIS
jgi:hypothetical protein